MINRRAFRSSLQRWFAVQGRDLPWRRSRDPYAILVSEFMTWRVLAAAYAETGQFQDAINAALEGARRAQADRQSSIVQQLQLDLSLYRQEIPLRDPTHGRGVPASR